MPDMYSPEGTLTPVLPEHAKFFESKGYTYASDKAVVVDDTSGIAYSIGRGEVDNQVGKHEETTDERQYREEGARLEEEHGGIGGQVLTGLKGAASTASGGLYDVVGAYMGGDDFRQTRRDEKRVNPGSDLVGQVGGYILPTGALKAPGLIGKAAKFSPVTAGERLAARVASTGADKGLLRAAAAKGAGYGLEGSAMGAQQTISDYSLAMTDLERERALASLGSNILLGGGLGGGFGVVSEGVAGVARSVKRAKKLADGIGKKVNVTDDIAKMDKPQLLALKKERSFELGLDIVEDMKVYTKEDSAFRALTGEDRGIIGPARKSLRKDATNYAKSTAKRPSTLEKNLFAEEGAIERAIVAKEKTLAAGAKLERDIIKTLDNDIANYKKALKYSDAEGAVYGDVFGINVKAGRGKGKGVKLDKAGMEEYRAMLQTGAYRKSQAEAIELLPAALEANRSIQAKILGVTDKTAPGMAEVEAALDALGTKKKGFVQQTAEALGTGTVIGTAGPLVGYTAGAIMASKVVDTVSDLVLGTLGKATNKTAKKTSKVVDSFVDVGAKVLQRTPPLATKVLASTRYSEKTPPLSPNLPKSGLVRDFKAREAEIYSKMTMGPNGVTMHPDARRELADKLAGVRVASPELADSLETIQNRKMSFLADKLPKKPDFLADSVGPDDWNPGKEAIRAFARYVAAVEDPAGVEERLADATITPQDVEAYRAVYPQRYASLRNDIAMRLGELQSGLPMPKRMALSIFTGLPVEPSMEISIFSKLQEQFATEPGTEGGTQSPNARPNFSAFGSVKSQDKTRSQQRAEG